MYLFVLIVSVAVATVSSVLQPSDDKPIIISSSSSRSSSFSSASSFSHSSTSRISSSGYSDSRCPNRCRPTCKVPNPKNCIEKQKCSYCGQGKVWHQNNEKCIPIIECPCGKSCNGDPNASIRELPPPCPSTCDQPDEFPCEKKGLGVGCACNIGYILDEEYGTCIEPDSCPCGNPCGVNGTFAYCKIDCPSSFCPIDDRRGIVICDPSRNCPTGCICKYGYCNCPTGCICKYGYSWKSKEDRTCILSEECPPVPCTRPNEVWNPCPPACISDDCDKNSSTPSTCITSERPGCRFSCTRT